MDNYLYAPFLIENQSSDRLKIIALIINRNPIELGLTHEGFDKQYKTRKTRAPHLSTQFYTRIDPFNLLSQYTDLHEPE